MFLQRLNSEQNQPQNESRMLGKTRGTQENIREELSFQEESALSSFQRPCFTEEETGAKDISNKTLFRLRKRKM